MKSATDCSEGRCEINRLRTAATSCAKKDSAGSLRQSSRTFASNELRFADVRQFSSNLVGLVAEWLYFSGDDGRVAFCSGGAIW